MPEADHDGHGFRLQMPHVQQGHRCDIRFYYGDGFCRTCEETLINAGIKAMQEDSK